MENGKKNILIGILIVLVLLLAGFICYDKIWKRNQSIPKETNNNEEKANINYEILNYQCKDEFCNSQDYANIKQLLKTSDIVNGLYKGKDKKNHAVVLESVVNKNRYLYLVDNDKYYFKNDNYHDISLIEAEYNYDGEGTKYVYDYNYAIVHKKITKHYEGYDVNTSNSKIFSFKNNKYVVQFDDYYQCSYVEYENQRFYKVSSTGENTLYDGQFNKIIDVAPYGNFALDNKYIFGVIEENSEYKFFRYNLADQKYQFSHVTPNVDGTSHWTYNYIVKYNNGEYEIYDFDGNSIFKTDEKSYLKGIKKAEYVLPEFPILYYSKAENKIKLIIEPDVCGDSSCPGKFGYSYYEYDISSKKIIHKFFTNIIPDDVYKNLIDGYVQFNY